MRGDGCGRHRRQASRDTRHAQADRRCGDRGREGGRDGRALPRARSAHGARQPRSAAVPRGGRPDPLGRRRRHHQSDGRHGRRSRDRRGREPDALRQGHGPRRRADAARACRGTVARDLHARLRHAEFRRRRLHLRVDARATARGREADPGAGREAGARDLRHGPPVVREAVAEGRAPRRSAALPALPRHSVGRARRHRHDEGDGRQPACRRALGGLRHRPDADADARAGDAARRPRARRPRGQPVARPRRARDERLARRACAADRRASRRACWRPPRGAASSACRRAASGRSSGAR